MHLRAALHVCSPIALALGVSACSAPVVDADELADGGSMTQSIVLVERVVTADGAPQTNVSAKFMRMAAAADPEVAERVVGSRLELPSTGQCLALRPAGAPNDAPNLSSLGSIELLDVGDVTLRVGGVSMPLAARAFPDVGELVSGVFYTSRDAAHDLPASAIYVIEASGGGLVDHFAIEATAPAGPEDVHVGDASLADGVALDEGSSAVVRWRPEASVAGDLVYVDIGSARTGAVVRCMFPDAGEGVVPASFLQSSVLGPFATAATLAVHRVRLGSFSASGIDIGEVRFDLATIGRATLR